MRIDKPTANMNCFHGGLIQSGLDLEAVWSCGRRNLAAIRHAWRSATAGSIVQLLIPDFLVLFGVRCHGILSLEVEASKTVEANGSFKPFVVSFTKTQHCEYEVRADF